MTAREPFEVPADGSIVQVTGLDDGTRYLLQNRSGGGVRLEYCNYPTDPTGEDLGWSALLPFEWLDTGDFDTGDPLWVRVVDEGSGSLTVIDV